MEGSWIQFIQTTTTGTKIVIAVVGAIIIAFSLNFVDTFVNSFFSGRRYKDEPPPLIPNPSTNEPQNENVHGRVDVSEKNTYDIDFTSSTWTKNALNSLSTHCCPIFDHIVHVFFQNAKKNSLGTLLDAGTGYHSLEWITGLRTSRWVAVTGDPKRQKSLSEKFASHIRLQDKIVLGSQLFIAVDFSGNWKDPKFMEGEVFDVVVADYLLGSVEGYAPYFQDRLFERLKPHVGGYLFIVGAEPLPDKSDDVHGQLIIDIGKARDACSLLVGDRPYREYPLDWVIRNLNKGGFKILNVSHFETTHSRDFVETQINVAESKLPRIENASVRNAMQEYLSELRRKVKRMKWPHRFMNDYVVSVVPIKNQSREMEVESTSENNNNNANGIRQRKKPTTSENPPVEEFLKDYVSPISQQNRISPRDEHE